MNFANRAFSIQEAINNLGQVLIGGSNGGINILSGKGGIAAAHVAAVGSGGTTGTFLFAVTQSGATGGGVTAAIAAGALPSIGTVVTVTTPGTKYSVADTVAVVGGSLTGGQIHITEIVMDEYDYIQVDAGVTFTELKDADGLDLLDLKNLSGIAFKTATILHSGTTAKLRNMLFTGGNVIGYNF